MTRVRSPRRARRWTAGLAATAIGIAGFAGAAQASPAAAPTKSGQAGDQVQAPVPKLDWQQCPSTWGDTESVKDPSLGISFTCTVAAVPLDYDKPNGTRIPLALRRVAATDQQNKIGTLFLNPGGPGGSGVDFMNVAWSLFSPWVRQKFDIVSFDPRGIARSAPLVCWSSQQEQRAATGAAEPLFPDTPAQYRASVAADEAFTKACTRNASPIINHMSTANVARDLDLLRQAVGDQKLTYDGISYGTYLGQTYAALFPNRIRAMVLDAVVDPVAYSTGGDTSRLSTFSRLGSDAGTYDTSQQFFRLCREAGPAKCSFAAFGDPAASFAKLAAAVRKDPVRIPVGGVNVEVTYQTLVGLTWQSMYAPSGWPDLADILTGLSVYAGVVDLPAGAAATGKAALARPALAQRLLSGAPMAQGQEGLPGVVCSDANNPKSHDAIYSSMKARDAGPAPYFGSPWGWLGDPCVSWPGKDADRFVGGWKTKTSAPVLIVGTTHDSATPYAGAIVAQRNLAGSRLLTYQGYGHPAAGQTVCVDNAISNYVLGLALPSKGATCAAAPSPFSASAGAGGSGGAVTKAARVKASQMLARMSLGLQS